MDLSRSFGLHLYKNAVSNVSTLVRAFSRGFFTGLRFKIIAIVTLVTGLGVLSSTYLTLTLQHRHLIDVAEATTAWLSRTITTSLDHAMLTNDWEMVELILQGIVNDRNIQIIRILDNSGVVKISTDEAEIGLDYAFLKTNCPTCQQMIIPTDDRAYILDGADNEKILLNVTKIENQPHCTSCHMETIATLGLLIIEKPMTEINNLMEAETRINIFSSLIVFIISAGIMLYLLRRTITQPITELSDGVARIGSGDLEHVIQLDNRDELSRLASSINLMRHQLQEMQAAMKQRNQELSVLNKVALSTIQTLDLNEILSQALHSVVQSFNLQAGCIYLIDESTGKLILRAKEGVNEEQIQRIEDIRAKQGWDISSQVSSSGEYLLIKDIADDERFKGLWTDPNGRSYLNVPLRSKRHAVGTMGLVTRPMHHFYDREIETIVASGHEISLVIDNAMLYEKTQSLAILEERDRLAREFHDKLAQDIGYLSLAIADATEMLSSGQVQSTGDLLVQLREVTQQTYADLREAIFNLRSTLPTGAGFMPELKLYVEEYQNHYRIPVNLDCRITPPPDLPPHVSLQVTRVIQEALSNVRKHANANQVRIYLEKDTAGMKICIQDDGCGFSASPTAGADWKHYGLQIMRERVESFGGDLKVESETGKGTLVCIWIPETELESK